MVVLHENKALLRGQGSEDNLIYLAGKTYVVDVILKNRYSVSYFPVHNNMLKHEMRRDSVSAW